MKQDLSEETVERGSYEVVQGTLRSLSNDLPKLVIDLQSLKGSATKQVTQLSQIFISC